MKIKELRGMDEENLKSKLIELRNELVKINAQVAIGTTPKNPGQVKNIKKTIARIMTIINEKKIEGDKESKKEGKKIKSMEEKRKA